MKILIVDDSKAMRMIVQRALARTAVGAHATVLEASSAAEALGMVAAHTPDLVLSDWNMPGMTGLELLDALRAEGVETAFGFITSESTPEMYRRALASGARFLVTKPFTPESLDRALAGA